MDKETEQFILPFFSVVIPVYNKEPHINRSISSVLRQTFQDFELIVVNDASTDKSLEEVKKFNDSRIRIFERSMPGPGGYAARNLGIKEAKAKWVVFLDADDEWYKDHLEELSQLIQQFQDSGLVSTSWNEIVAGRSAEANLFRKSTNISKPISINYKEYLKTSIEIDMPFCASSLAIKKKILLSVEGFPEGKARRGGDVDTWLRVMAIARNAAWSPKISAIYHRDSVNMVTKTESFSAKWEKNTIDNLLKDEQDRETRKFLRKYCNKRIVYRYINTRLEGMSPKDRLLPNVFISYLNLKQFLIVLASILPNRALILLNETGHFINHRILKRGQ